MRRRVLQALAPAVAAVAVVGCAPAPTLPPTADSGSAPAGAAQATEAQAASAPSESPAPRLCAEVAEELPLSAQVGQLFMVGVSTAGLDETTRRAITQGRVGSVVLLENSRSGADDIRLLTAELGSLGTADLPLLIAVDQEGGRVQRLRGPGFDDIPTAVDQGAMSGDELREAAETWGEQLRRAGIHYNLAPVADVVPADLVESNAPIGALSRHYGNDAGAVGEQVAEYVSGMDAAGIRTSLKHFPGLGKVDTNTDFGAARDDVTGRDDAGLDAFRAGIDAGADSVMVSSAVFSRIDPDQEAVFSHTVITDLLRDDLGFDGVVIADDLGAARSVAGIPAAERAVRFLDAGGDLAINATPGLMADMIEATAQRAADDEDFAERVAESATRVLRLKAAAGLVDCA
ncbi:glycoside hydrolase family 3 N-terminal domain-containing protein [Tessaracoccus lapidicaptus]|uniref:glycoside hydrolase family 3 N-terminal domain-containing protein n=1 Tax=Tessaracoccus lapidicaptus TaxID=1427523 RepID=UPI00333E6AED